jgi:hypothetical protein
MKKLLIFTLGIVLGLSTHLFKKEDNTELLNLRQMNDIFLDHLDSCHSSSVHEKCFRIGE